MSPGTLTPTELLYPRKFHKKTLPGQDLGRVIDLKIHLSAWNWHLSVYCPGRLPWFHRACLSTTLDKIIITDDIISSIAHFVNSLTDSLRKILRLAAYFIAEFGKEIGCDSAHNDACYANQNIDQRPIRARKDQNRCRKHKSYNTMGHY